MRCGTVMEFALGRAFKGQIRRTMALSKGFNVPLRVAFVDLCICWPVRKPLLWQVLRKHDVHGKRCERLFDLHNGTRAAVKLGGRLSEWCQVRSVVGQSYVLPLRCSNAFVDFWVKSALAEAPACTLQITQLLSV